MAYKTILQLGDLSSGTITNLLQGGGGYELQDCSYDFFQEITQKGKPNSDIQGGIISVSMRELPTDEILRWSIDPKRFLSGMITLYNLRGIPVEKVFFEEAACVNLKIGYAGEYVATLLTISARKLRIDAIGFDPGWTHH